MQRGTCIPVLPVEGVTPTLGSGLQVLMTGDVQKESWRATLAPLAFPPTSEMPTWTRVQQPRLPPYLHRLGW